MINTYAGIWMDYPAFWEPRGTATISFVDGSTRLIKFFNPDLGEILVQHGIPVQPGHPDRLRPLRGTGCGSTAEAHVRLERRSYRHTD